MKKALLIGIDYINNPEHYLKGCINDIIVTRNMLIDAYDYNASDITILRDDSGDFLAPTRTNILHQLELLFSQSENLEEIWFHYSGHGSQLQNQNREMKQIIIPSNYQEGIIQDTELLELIQQISKDCRAIMVFDCCHSGTICDMPWTFEYTNANYMVTHTLVTHTNPIDMSNPNIYVFSGCRDNQTSADSMNTLDQAVGAFSNALVESLRASHHNISIMDLYKNTCIFLLKNGYSQNPVLSSSTKTPSYIIRKS
jgi:hypothetical protein